MEKIDKVIEILQAFKEGKTIEFCGTYINWVKIDNLTELLERLHSDKYQVRIKKEPTYRPYASSEEFIKSSNEHGHWIKEPSLISTIDNWMLPTKAYEDHCSIVGNDGMEMVYRYNYLLNKCKWFDGTSCGILEQ